ncbi:MAG: 23S rRNA (uracil(1939)-C(5))-methyltransferase RlmD [Bacteroidota bacterium]|nr:23S rRNA (uracil(1939)-C(5))-methyltransferase RlmD [Bacteroidota bacterium]
MSSKFKNFLISDAVIESITSSGAGVARTNHGAVVFIKNCIPGDIVDLEVFKKKKNKLHGKILKFKFLSKDRVTPKCEHFGICGGCKWQNMNYNAQLHHKDIEIKQIFKKIGNVQIKKYLPIVECKEHYGFRNKMEFSFSSTKWLTEKEISSKKKIKNRDAIGFHISGMWDKVVDIKYCHLQKDVSNEIRNEIKKYCIDNNYVFFNHRKKEGFLRTLTFRTSSLGEMMLIFHFYYYDKQKIEMLLGFIKTRFKKISSILYVINNKENDSIYDLDIFTYHGKYYIKEKIGGLYFKISPKSFFQTNLYQTNVLYNKSLEMLEIKKNDIVYDLYCGLGTISQYIAQYCKKVVGIEIIDEAIQLAIESSKMNGLKNIYFEKDDINNISKLDLLRKYGKPNVIILDPPRQGLTKKIIKVLLEIKSEKILYISCNPSTQARDLEILSCEYEVTLSQAIDMFPQTSHVENIVLLTNK